MLQFGCMFLLLVISLRPWGKWAVGTQNKAMQGKWLGSRFQETTTVLNIIVRIPCSNYGGPL
eukprot:5183040-Amphidinium_carterae.1